MKHLLRKISCCAAAVVMVGLLAGCPGPEDLIDDDDDDIVTAVTETVKEGGEITYGGDGVVLTTYAKYAKPGAKVHVEVSNRDDNGNEYCKVMLLSDWNDSGVTEAYYEGSDENKIDFDLTDGEGNAVHRPFVAGEGEFYFVLNEASLAKPSLTLRGNATVTKVYIEYVGGKKTEEEVNPPIIRFDGAGISQNQAKTETTIVLAYPPVTATSVKLVFMAKDQLPVGEDNKAEAGHDFKIKGHFTLKLGEEVIWDNVAKTFEVSNNLYGADYQCKAGILADKTLTGGSVITLICSDVSVEAQNAEDAALITDIIIAVIDDSQAANYWKDLVDVEDFTFWQGTAVVEEAPAQQPGAPVILLDEVWSADWVTKNFAAAKFADATDDSVIVMEVSKDTDRLVDNNAENPYSECFAIIQLLDKTVADGKFSAGTATTEEGTTVTTSDNQLGGIFKDSDPNTKFYTLKYKPTADEWAKIKEAGLGIQSHGVMFRKISLVTPAPAGE